MVNNKIISYLKKLNLNGVPLSDVVKGKIPKFSNNQKLVRVTKAALTMSFFQALFPPQVSQAGTVKGPLYEK